MHMYTCIPIIYRTIHNSKACSIVLDHEGSGQTYVMRLPEPSYCHLRFLVVCCIPIICIDTYMYTYRERHMNIDILVYIERYIRNANIYYTLFYHEGSGQTCIMRLPEPS